MGAIQNSVNQMLGTTTGAALGAMHVLDQTKQLQIKKIEAEQEAFNAKNELKQNTSDITHQMVLEGNDEGLTPKEGETPEQAETRAVNEYLEAKSEAAEENYQYQMDKVKHPSKSKRVEMARKAADEKQDAINARRNLEFNFDIASKKLKALGGKM